ncbi:MAG TPA: cytochrome c-type biogenesis protein CcmH [Polyangia bacterium]
MRAATILLVLMAALTARAVPPSELNQPASDGEREIMHNLACTCPTCNREPIDECTCALAAQMRGEVKKQLAGRDLSTEAARKLASVTVRASIAGLFGAAALTPRPAARVDPRLDWLPVIVFVGGLFVLVVVTRRSLARRRAEKAAGPPRG